MKYLLCFLALALQGKALAAIDAAQVTEPKAGLTERLDNPPPHHPVIEVKFVLTRAPQESQIRLHGDIDSQRAAIVPFSLSGLHAVPLRDRYWDPNVYSCDGRRCGN